MFASINRAGLEAAFDEVGQNVRQRIALISDAVIVDDFEKEIYKIGIIREYQGKGLGKYFLEEVIKLSKTSRLLLEVNSTNKNAIKLYESCNFKKYYIRKKYYSDGNDAILMELKLGELL